MPEHLLTELDRDSAARVRAARAFIFDMDGTLVLGDKSSGGHKALPGAAELLSGLRSRDIPFQIFTNGTAFVPAHYAASLRKAGLDVRDEEMMTPATAAADYFVRRKMGRVRVLGCPGVSQPLIDAGMDVIGPGEESDSVHAVLTGWYRDFTYPELERACHSIWEGANLFTCSHVPFFAAAGGRAIGSSYAINVMIRSLTNARINIVGKPARAAFDCALGRMGLKKSAARDVVVVGDDPALEMRMAQGAGALGIGVTTGLHDHDSFGAQAVRQRPHATLSGLAPILDAIG